MSNRADDIYVHPAACERRHEEINTRLADIVQMLKTLDDRLYRSNGHRSVLAMLNDHERVIRCLLWITAVAGTSIIGGVMMGVWALIKFLVKEGAV